jgi:hypothetical protein
VGTVAAVLVAPQIPSAQAIAAPSARDGLFDGHAVTFADFPPLGSLPAYLMNGSDVLVAEDKREAGADPLTFAPVEAPVRSANTDAFDP